MPKGMMNIQGLMKQAQKMQEQIQKAQEELKHKTVATSVGGGMVTVVFSGTNELLKITIDEEAVDADDIETLQDLVLAAVNEGLKKAQAMAESEMGDITGGMKIPGMF